MNTLHVNTHTYVRTSTRTFKRSDPPPARAGAPPRPAGGHPAHPGAVVRGRRPDSWESRSGSAGCAVGDRGRRADRSLMGVVGDLPILGTLYS